MGSIFNTWIQLLTFGGLETNSMRRQSKWGINITSFW